LIAFAINNQADREETVEYRENKFLGPLLWLFGRRKALWRGWKKKKMVAPENEDCLQNEKAGENSPVWENLQPSEGQEKRVAHCQLCLCYPSPVASICPTNRADAFTGDWILMLSISDSICDHLEALQIGRMKRAIMRNHVTKLNVAIEENKGGENRTLSLTSSLPREQESHSSFPLDGKEVLATMFDERVNCTADVKSQWIVEHGALFQERRVEALQLVSEEVRQVFENAKVLIKLNKKPDELAPDTPLLLFRWRITTKDCTCTASRWFKKV